LGRQTEEATKEESSVVTNDNDRKYGYLEKLSQFVRLHERRFFVFTQEGFLKYYKDEKDDTEPKEIKIAREVQIRTIDDRSFAFEIETKTRTYKLIASTEKERDEWVSILNEYRNSLPESEEK
ncbi:15193_t:CDS:1, partial [Acaulospora colombiana]